MGGKRGGGLAEDRGPYGDQEFTEILESHRLPRNMEWVRGEGDISYLLLCNTPSPNLVTLNSKNHLF